MKPTRWITGLAGLLLVLISVWQIAAAGQELEIDRVRPVEYLSAPQGPPLTIITPDGVTGGSRPTVLVGHGFAGSGVVMRGFALALAHAGYPVLLWDFDGHGSNPRPLERDGLLKNAEAVLAEAQARGLADPERVAILGHSMGSGVALGFGVAHPETAATIAVSPVGEQVTEQLPHNLLLMAGSLEGAFVQNAEQLLSEAGGAGGDPLAGTGREFVVVPGVEHISILFAPVAHNAARDWLDQTFGPQPGARAYTDRRVLWYGLGVLGSLLVTAALAPRAATTPPTQPAGRSIWHRLGALAGGALGATLLLWLAGQVGLVLQDLLGLLVGGYLIIWFGVAGLFSLLLLRGQPSRPSRRAVLGGLGAFAALWLSVGLLGQWVWLPWLLATPRLMLWPLGVLLLLPWFLAAGEMIQEARAAGRLGWWLAQSTVLVGTFLLALRLSPELSFLVIILPLFPLILGLHALTAGPQRSAWSFALSGALFTSWLLLAVFPLQ